MGQGLSDLQNWNKDISFTIEGKLHKVSFSKTVNGTSEITPQTSLVTYLRDVAGLRDTKAMCRQGGCGACIVSATFIHPHTNRKVTRAVNSCLVPILACHNWEINTVHGIGNRSNGYHPIQRALAHFNGSQCGFCSAGMVMNMYSLTQSRDVITMQDVEDAFGGNLCRCTGYRTIMNAFKSLADDADPALVNILTDIEDLKICKKTNKICEGACQKDDLQAIHIDLGDEMHWYKVYTIQNILDFFSFVGNSEYILVAGNTGQGVYEIKNPPKYWVDISDVKELVSYQISDSLVLGANMAINDVMDLMQKLSDENREFWYLKQMWNHLDLVATVPVRNIGTLAGNLSLKHDHREFPSDLFLLFETVGAQITIVQSNGYEVTKSVEEYLDFDMNKCLMKSISLPPLKQDSHLFQSYKIMPRVQNAHAHVNAGFLIQFENNFEVISARIVYGGINPSFVHAKRTEEYLKGKRIFNNDVLQGVWDNLNDELHPDFVPPDPTPAFRKRLAINLFYKFILATAPEGQIRPKYKSGGKQLEHKLLTGVNLFQTDQKMYPLTQPVNKIEAVIQCAGEAQYINDIPAIPGEVFGALVLAEALPLSIVDNVDTSEAMKMPGVLSYVSYTDVPGKNTFTTSIFRQVEETLFCSGTVEYNGQPLGVIVADTYENAITAATKVKITYKKSNKKPYFDIKSILEDKRIERLTEQAGMEPKTKGNDVRHVIKGTATLIGQYHFQMETQRCLCVPTEDGGYDIYPSTQWMDHVQITAASALNISMDKIYVQVRRIGGAYGSKIIRASLVSTACAVACHKVRKPLRLILPLDVNMKVIGKRFPTYSEYEVGVNDNGVVQYMNNKLYMAAGTSGTNESLMNDMPRLMANGYNSDAWKINSYLVKTDMAGNCFCRAPFTSEPIAVVENIMEHISTVVNKSPLEVRRANLSNKPEQQGMLPIINDLIKWANYSERLKQVDEFNAKNRWIKRGLSLAIMDYKLTLAAPYTMFLSIYAADGTVAISHGGIECGQGINTKVVQVVAHQLGIPMSTISVKPSNTLTAPNSIATGGSITSESVCFAAIQVCKEINRRLQPIKDRMNNPAWKDLILNAKLADVELSASAICRTNDVPAYPIPGSCLCEVEVDILTGEHVIHRVDLLEDVGKSLSPFIDVGQVEGAFIMGIGNYTCEELVYGKEGQLLNPSTWTYKVPGVKDVPEEFNIMFKKDSDNPAGVLNSKATGEPALCLSIGVPFAIRHALASAKKDVKPDDKSFLNINGSFSVEFTLLNSPCDYKDFKL